MNHSTAMFITRDLGFGKMFDHPRIKTDLKRIPETELREVALKLINLSSSSRFSLNQFNR